MLGASLNSFGYPKNLCEVGIAIPISTVRKLGPKVIEVPEIAIWFRLKSDSLCRLPVEHRQAKKSGHETDKAGSVFTIHRHLQGVHILGETKE